MFSCVESFRVLTAPLSSLRSAATGMRRRLDMTMFVVLTSAKVRPMERSSK